MTSHDLPMEEVRRLLEEDRNSPGWLSRADAAKSAPPLACMDCKKTAHQDSTVTETTCPYAADVNNDPNVYAVLCDSCYHERCMDI